MTIKKIKRKKLIDDTENKVKDDVVNNYMQIVVTFIKSIKKKITL